MWWKVAILAVLVAAGIGVPLFLSHSQDSKRAEDAIQKFIDAGAADRDSVDWGYSDAKMKAASIRSEEMRSETLGEIERIYEERKKVFDEADQLRHDALALMNRQHSNILALRASRVQAEELARKIKVSKDSTDLLRTLDEMFNEQQEFIAAEELRRAEEEQARRLEAERLLQEEQHRAAEAAAEAAAELERQRVAAAQEAQAAQAAQYRYQPSAPPEPTDCCCKTKVDVGFFFTEWEFKYKRLSKKHCADPGFWDDHVEGWCVPDSYCY